MGRVFTINHKEKHIVKSIFACFSIHFINTWKYIKSLKTCCKSTKTTSHPIATKSLPKLAPRVVFVIPVEASPSDHVLMRTYGLIVLCHSRHSICQQWLEPFAVLMYTYAWVQYDDTMLWCNGRLWYASIPIDQSIMRFSILVWYDVMITECYIVAIC